MNFNHYPVMLEECMSGLNIKDGGIYFDGTLGGGNHTNEILRRSAPTGRVIATDLDDDALAAAKKKLSEYSERIEMYKRNFKSFEEVLELSQVDKLDGVLLDLGVSSHQLDSGDRGFSYMKPDAPLDMRMDQTSALTAEKIVNTYSQKELTKILREYGEENFAASISSNIVKAREKKQISCCGELVEIIENSIPYKFRQNGPCARKSFQAIRIAVNGELDGLYDTLIGLVNKLKKGGRIAVITFHSLEDRIVKQAFRLLEQDCICDKSLPVCVCNKVKEIEILTKKPITASAKELAVNSRSRSAKLRIAEKII